MDVARQSCSLFDALSVRFSDRLIVLEVVFCLIQLLMRLQTSKERTMISMSSSVVERGSTSYSYLFLMCCALEWFIVLKVVAY